jgi:hypothetical protein
MALLIESVKGNLYHYHTDQVDMKRDGSLSNSLLNIPPRWTPGVAKELFNFY